MKLQNKIDILLNMSILHSANRVLLRLTFILLGGLMISAFAMSVSAAEAPTAKVAGNTGKTGNAGNTENTSNTNNLVTKKYRTAAQIKTLMQEKIPDISIIEVKLLPNLGLFQVLTSDYTSIFVSRDGNDFVVGEHYSFGTAGKLKNLSKARQEQGQFALAAAIPKEELIIFPAKKKTKSAGWILVFTDVDCGYCRKLHREIDEVNRLGIEVRYAFFPRSGPDTESFKKAINVWCGEDRQASMTAAKAGLPLANKVCPNPVLEQFNTGIKVGVRGTPTIFTENGKKIPGYIAPAELLKLLQG